MASHPKKRSSPRGSDSEGGPWEGGGHWYANARSHLREIFGLSSLRPGQVEVIRHVMSGRNTLALMATGAGKSLCYQLPATLLPGVTLVVSPLIALMKDQCDKLRSLGIAAVQINSGQLAVDREKAEEAVRSGSAKIILTTPEHLTNPQFIRDLQQHAVSLLVIDEAHCICEWGHDFRPAFLEIATAHKRLGHPVLLALTATATEADIQNVMQQLDVPDMQVVNTGIYRSNLYYAVDHVTSEEGKLARLKTLIQRHEGQGIVYASTIKAAQTVLDALTETGVSAVMYHGHMAAGGRQAAQEAYMRGQARVMVATQAFGLGIDKRDTRFVIHYQMPSHLESYYQESGRAGRDGKTARCTLLYLPKDRSIQQFFLATRYPSLEDIQAVYQQLQQTPPNDGAWTLPLLTQAVDRPNKKLQLASILLRKEGVVKANAAGQLRLVRTNLDASRMEKMLLGYTERKSHDREMLEALVFYCQSGLCRWKMLLQHFDPSLQYDRCGHCDNCERMVQAEAEAQAVSLNEALETTPEPQPNFQVGDAVRVPRYGRGRIVKLESLGVTVHFPNGPDRSFLAEYVKPA